MLTLFTTTKPFTGSNRIIQTNAIRSWLALSPQPEIIIFGDEDSTEEAASNLGVRYVADFECNDYGTPLISSIFGITRDIAGYPLLCYINADIILLGDFIPAIQRVKEKSFLIIGRRWDLDITESIDFNSRDWEANLRDKLEEKGVLHAPSGLDYFIYPRELYGNIPPFAIGRSAWDNWLAYQARKLKASLIDATGAITVVHQNHGYSHAAGGEFGVWEGPEAIRNLEFTKHGEYAFTLEHVTHVMDSRGVKQALTPRHLFFRLEAATVLRSNLRFLRKPMKALIRFMACIRSGKQTS